MQGMDTGGFLAAQVVKNLPANAGNARYLGSVPELERHPGGGNGNPLRYFCLKDSMDFANKGPSSQGYGFSSGHVWI